MMRHFLDSAAFHYFLLASNVGALVLGVYILLKPSWAVAKWKTDLLKTRIAAILLIVFGTVHTVSLLRELY